MENLGETLYIRALLTLVCDLAQEFTTSIEVKDCRNTHGTEEADEEGLSPFFDLVDMFVHGEDDGQAAEYKDEDADKDESVDGNDVVVGKAIPRTYSAVPGEDGHIEEHIDGRLEGVIFCLEAEPIAFASSA